MFKLTSRPFSRWNKNCYACVCACAYACVPSENQALASRHAIINTIPIPVILRVLKHLCLSSLMSLSLPRGFSFQFSSHGMTKRLNGLRRQRLTCAREQSAHMREEPGWPWSLIVYNIQRNPVELTGFNSTHRKGYQSKLLVVLSEGGRCNFWGLVDCFIFYHSCFVLFCFWTRNYIYDTSVSCV